MNEQEKRNAAEIIFSDYIDAFDYLNIVEYLDEEGIAYYEEDADDIAKLIYRARFEI